MGFDPFVAEAKRFWKDSANNMPADAQAEGLDHQVISSHGVDHVLHTGPIFHEWTFYLYLLFPQPNPAWKRLIQVLSNITE